MPRIDREMLKTPSGSLNIGSERTVAVERMEMTVFQTDADLFVDFTSAIYEAIATQYAAATGHVTALPFTREEFVGYAFTGMRSRLARVNNERFEIRCDDPWQMPAALAAVINSVGRVMLEAPVIEILPVWNPEYNTYLLDRRTWQRVTQGLRGVSKNPQMKLVLVNALAGDRSGDEELLSLIPVRDVAGRIVQIGHRTHQVDPIAAAVFIISGFAPEVYDGVSLALPALLLPPFYIEVGALRQNLWRLTDAA
jgi:hypothetical protein